MTEKELELLLALAQYNVEQAIRKAYGLGWQDGKREAKEAAA